MKTYADHARGWLRKSESDITTLHALLESGISYDIACFHAQQAAEKALKSILAFSELPIFKTHDLPKLLGAIVLLHPSFSANMDELKLLTTYAIDSRYVLAESRASRRSPRDGRTSTSSSARHLAPRSLSASGG